MNAPPGFAVRLGLAYAAFFAIQGIYLPFFPLWLKEQGLAATQIAAVLALPAIVRVLAIMPVTIWADRSAERAHLATGFWIIAALVMTAHLTLSGFVVIAAAHLILAFFWLPQLPIIDALTLEGVRRFGTDYGRVRLWGSVAFLAANVAGGMIFSRIGPGAVAGVLVAGFWLAVLVSLAVPKLGRARRRRRGRTTFRSRAFTLVMLGAALVQAGHAFSYGFGAIYWSERGWSAATIGVLWAISVLAEVALFRVAGPSLRRRGPTAILLVGGAGAVVRWVLFPLEPGIAGTVLLQIMHAASFGATHLGQQAYIARETDPAETTAAQGYATMLAGATMGAAGLASGWLYARLGVDGFLAMAALSGLGTLVLIVGLRHRAADTTLQ